MQDGIIIKGNGRGLVAEIDMNGYPDYSEMFNDLIGRLSKEKSFIRAFH